MNKVHYSSVTGACVAAMIFTVTTAAKDLRESVPKAVCGPGDRTEVVQGQMTLAERFSERAQRAYACNLELIGQFEGEGAGFDMEALGDCAYYSTMPTPKLRHPGTVVLDVSDSSNPHATAYLASPAMLHPSESLTIDPLRKKLIANRPVKTTAEPFDVYDLSKDCRHPRLERTAILPGIMSHAGAFGPDGQLFYGTSWDIPDQSSSRLDPTLPPFAAVFAVDMSDASTPKGIATWTPEGWKTHSISVSKDGMRAYLAVSRRLATGTASDPQGLAILDVSDFQLRRRSPSFRVISTLFWDETDEAQFILPATVGGSPYLVFTDLTGAVGYVHPAKEDVCKSGKPSYGFPRIIDIADEKKPRTISKLMLEATDPVNCSKVAHDPTTVYGYGSLVCDVDSRDNAKMLACVYFEGGLRVFDIRNPSEPREIAYYKPPARRKEARPGSMLRAWGYDDLTADPVIVARFRKNREIWILSSDNAFQVVGFSKNFRMNNKELFADE